MVGRGPLKGSKIVEALRKQQTEAGQKSRRLTRERLND